jgi:hypothetical protein
MLVIEAFDKANSSISFTNDAIRAPTFREAVRGSPRR